MRHLFPCFLFCACTSVSHPQVIENQVSADELPSLRKNMAATVSIFYSFADPDTGKLHLEQTIGVVIDTTHVMSFYDLTGSTVAWLNGLDKVNILSIGVTRYSPNISDPKGLDILPAKVVAQESFVAAILETFEPLPVSPIKFANNKSNLGESVYVLGSVRKNPSLGARPGVVVEPLHPNFFGYSEDDFVINISDVGWTAKCPVFNDQHEFIGFRVYNSSVEIVDHGSKPKYGYAGYYIKSIRSIAPLLRQAGVFLPVYDDEVN